MRANKWLGIGMILVIGGLGCKVKTEEPSAKKMDANTVEVVSLESLKLVKIQKTMFPETIEVNGKISIPDKDIVNLSARAQGRIDALPVAIGDRVHLGQVLGTIWSPDLMTAAEEYKMAKTQNDAELLELSKAKLQSLGLKPSDVEGAKSHYPIHSPIEGVVMDKKVNAGSAVNVGDLIVVVGKNTERQFAGEVPPDVALKIRAGMAVRFPEVKADLKAVVANVSPVADPATNLVKVRCQFVGSDPLTVPQETYLKAEIIVRETESLVVPSKALILTVGGERIFVQDDKNPKRFTRVPVKINSRNKLQLDVVETPDIKDGKVSVTEGAILLEGIIEGED